VVVDREKAGRLGISETDVANAVLFSLNGNGQTDPIIYTDPQNGNEYYISAWLAEEHRKDRARSDHSKPWNILRPSVDRP